MFRIMFVVGVVGVAVGVVRGFFRVRVFRFLLFTSLYFFILPFPTVAEYSLKLDSSPKTKTPQFYPPVPKNSKLNHFSFTHHLSNQNLPRSVSQVKVNLYVKFLLV